MGQSSKRRPLSARERARQQAVEKAERFARRQGQLQELAVEYLLAGEELGRAVESVERRMAPLLQEAQAAREKAALAQSEVVVRMRQLETPEPEIAARLGITQGEVRRCIARARGGQHTGQDGTAQPPAPGGAGGGGQAGPEAGGDAHDAEAEDDVDGDGDGDVDGWDRDGDGGEQPQGAGPGGLAWWPDAAQPQAGGER